jgi:hypothetical protein
LDSDTHDEVCKMANRLLSEDFEKVHEVRKQPLTLAIALAKRVSRSVEPRGTRLDLFVDETAPEGSLALVPPSVIRRP